MVPDVVFRTAARRKGAKCLGSKMWGSGIRGCVLSSRPKNPCISADIWGAESRHAVLQVTGMTCSNCSFAVERWGIEKGTWEAGVRWNEVMGRWWVWVWPDRAMKQLKYVERCQAQREINLIDVDGLGRVGPWDFRLFRWVLFRCSIFEASRSPL